MKQNLRLLDQIEIAKPCPANWDEMKGDDQVRHCSLCRLNVYNVAEMSAEDALKLVQSAEGRLCVRLYRREDGTVITKDCPKGMAAFRQRVAKRFVLAASLALSAIGCGKIGDQLKEDFGMSRFKTTVAPTPPVAVAGMIAPMPSPTKAKPIAPKPPAKTGKVK